MQDLSQYLEDESIDIESSKASYINNCAQVLRLDGLDSLARTEFLMKNNDLLQPWFYKNADRSTSVALLAGKPLGTFLVRPSSQRGCYAVSYVSKEHDPADNTSHHIIYGLFPGYSLSKAPTSSAEVFASLSELVQHCDFLHEGLTNDAASSRLCQESQVTNWYDITISSSICVFVLSRWLVSPRVDCCC